MPTTIRITKTQAEILKGVSGQVANARAALARAERARELALAMALAGHGIEKARVLECDWDRATICVDADDASAKEE